MKRRVFISYKRVDHIEVDGVVKKIEDTIKENCWIDRKEIPSDSRWDNEIKSAIDDCEVFVFFCSKAHCVIESLENDWTYKELNYAFEKRKHIEVLKIDDAPLPEWVKRCLPFAEVFDIASFDQAEILYANIFKWLARADDRKKDVMPDGIFKVGNLHYCAMEDKLSVKVVNPYKGAKEAANHDNCPAIIIPDSIIYAGCEYEVVMIGESAFEDCYNLRHVIIPYGVRSIGHYAFKNCKSGVSIDIPDSVEEIGTGAFEGCSSLDFIHIPKGVVTIADWVFSGCCSLTSIELPNGLESIGFYAFDGCSALQYIRVPESVTFIDKGAFGSCSSLRSIILPEGLTVLEGGILADCSSLASLVIPPNVKTIYGDPFSGCTALESIVIPSSVEYIMDNVFSGCTALKSIVVESGNEIYDSRNDCNAIIETKTNTLIASCSETVIPLSVTTIGSYAFDRTSLHAIIIPEGVTSISSRAFCSSANLMQLSLPSTLEKVGSSPFCYCKSLFVINIPKGSKEKFMAMESLREFEDKFVEM